MAFPTRLVAAGALALLLVCPAALAQTDCEAALALAQKTFELGLFEDLPQQLAPCLGARLSRRTAVEVHALLARAYLANDEPEKARAEVSTILRLDSAFEAGGDPRLAALVAQVRREEQTVQVASVSKSNESLREAPATVLVITADEILRRGYIDLEQLLHDLPGFDISRLNGAIYSTIYQRGYNSSSNDRNLLLIDGIEQNDLSSGSGYLSRQYPLSNIDRVEVIYGPASTMYGANAYTGVINVLTKDAEALVAENDSFEVGGQVTGGGYGVMAADLNLAGRDRSGTIAWSLTGNVFTSDERDLSHLDPWDYSYRNYDYKRIMQRTGTPQERAVLCARPSPYIDCTDAGIFLTDEGEALMRRLDAEMVRAEGLGFDEGSNQWAINGKLRIANLLIGLQSWRSQENTVSAYGAQFGGDMGLTSRETAIYFKYSLPLATTRLNVFTRYVQMGTERARPALEVLHHYASGFLDLYSLVEPCQSPRDPLPVSCAPAQPWVERLTYGLFSSQIRSEVNLAWESPGKLAAVGGLELTKSSVQSQADQTSTGPGLLISLPLESPEQIDHTDVALYAQGSWRVRPSLKLVAAGRFSYNRIENKPNASGFGTLFTPRVAVVYTPLPKQLTFKAIYSEAFKDPTDAQKYGVLFTYLNAYRSNGLDPERVRNIELTAGWEPNERLAVDASLYESRYSDVVAYGYPRDAEGNPIPCVLGCQQWQNRDSFRIRGLQLTARYKLRHADLWGNYTHTAPFQTDPRDFFGNPIAGEVRIGGVAGHRANAGVDFDWSARGSAGMRVHYVGARPVGAGTTLASPFTEVEGRTTIDAVISYRDLLPRATFQLVANNLLDEQYYDPGADLTTLPRVLQQGRTLYLRLLYRPR